MAVPKLRFKEFLGDWSKSTLGNISEIFDGTHQTPKYVDSGVKFVSVENINDLYSTDKYITKDAFDADFKNKPRANDILMTRITAGEIGATAIVKNDEPLGYYVSLALIRPNNYCLSGYLNQYISTNIFKNELHKRIIHTAFPKKINLGDINDCEVSYPSKDEQTKIANFLTAVDEKISQLNEQHQLMIQYKKGVMQKIFSQEIRFKDDNGEEFGEWIDKTLSDVGEIITGKTPSIQNPDLWEGNILFITPTDLNNRKIQMKTERTVSGKGMKILPINTIVFTCIASIGKMAITGKPSITNQQINSIIVKKDNFQFIYYALLNIVDFIKSTQSTTTMPIINKTEFSKFVIKVPCVREQTKIANFLSNIDDKIENLALQLEQVRNWKKGLLQQIFM
jgi:type I restriction-modification system, subunit S